MPDSSCRWCKVEPGGGASKREKAKNFYMTVMLEAEYPCRNGYWRNKNNSMMLIVINGENAQLKHMTCLDYQDTKPFSLFNGKIISGDFGPASKELSESSGMENCNLKWDVPALGIQMPCIVSNEGKKIHKYAFSTAIMEMWEWMDELQLEELREAREPLHSPNLPSYITARAGQLGKLLWFSGPPGSGKSTSAQLMARSHGYVYYEVDCFLNGANPFIDIHEENPAKAFINQKPMKIDQPDVLKVTQDFIEDLEKVKKGRFENLASLNTDESRLTVTRHILQQRQRIGGDWAVAFACPSRQARQKLREYLGSELVFIVLTMTKECAQKRLGSRQRQQFAEMLEKLHGMYEDAGEGEENAYSVKVDEHMSKDDVIAKVLQILERL